MQPQCVAATACSLGESPLWVPEEGRLYWLDLLDRTVHRYDPVVGSDDRLDVGFDDQLACLARRAGDGLILALADGVHGFDGRSLGPVLASPAADRPATCLNDGKVDRHGCLWIGSSDRREEQPLGSLWRLRADGGVQEIDRGFVVANGPAFSPDGRTAYFADTFARRLYAYDVHADGTPGPRRLFAEVPDADGYPDGLTVDRDGFVWSAHWDGWRVTRYDPTGRVDRIVRLSVPRVTSCAFGGDDLSVLFVTTARVDLSAADLAAAPLSGGLFAIPTPFHGTVEPIFAG